MFYKNLELKYSCPNLLYVDFKANDHMKLQMQILLLRLTFSLPLFKLVDYFEVFLLTTPKLDFQPDSFI